MRVILDGVFNHCGAQFFAFRDVLEKQRESRYADWFYRLQFPVTYPEAGERPNYECFCYERLMPKLDTSNDEVRDYLLRASASIGCASSMRTGGGWTWPTSRTTASGGSFAAAARP